LLNNKTKYWKRTLNAIDNRIKKFEYKQVEINNKKKQYELREVKLTVVSLLFKAVPELVKQCFKFDNKAYISKLKEISVKEYEQLKEAKSDKACDVFGKYYKII